MTPIRRPYSFTSSAFRVFGSNFIVAIFLWCVPFIVCGVERLLFRFRRLPLSAYKGLHGRHECPRYEQDVLVKNAHEVEQGIEARHDLSGFDGGDVWLGQADLRA